MANLQYLHNTLATVVEMNMARAQAHLQAIQAHELRMRQTVRELWGVVAPQPQAQNVIAGKSVSKTQPANKVKIEEPSDVAVVSKVPAKKPEIQSTILPPVSKPTNKQTNAHSLKRAAPEALADKGPPHKKIAPIATASTAPHVPKYCTAEQTARIQSYINGVVSPSKTLLKHHEDASSLLTGPKEGTEPRKTQWVTIKMKRRMPSADERLTAATTTCEAEFSLLRKAQWLDMTERQSSKSF